MAKAYDERVFASHRLSSSRAAAYIPIFLPLALGWPEGCRSEEQWATIGGAGSARRSRSRPQRSPGRAGGTPPCDRAHRAGLARAGLHGASGRARRAALQYRDATPRVNARAGTSRRKRLPHAEGIRARARSRPSGLVLPAWLEESAVYPNPCWRQEVRGYPVGGY